MAPATATSLDRAFHVMNAHFDLLKSTGLQLETKLNEDESNRKAAEITGLLKAFNTQWVDYEGAAMTVQNSIPDDELAIRLPEEIADFGRARVDFLMLETQATMYLASNSVSKTPPRQPSPVRAPKVKLPELKIPDFDGNVVEWPGFWSSFSVIHTHPELTPDVKMMHLTKYVKGDAARTIQGLHISAGNYDSAVKMLTDRFNRTDLIIASHLNSLRHLPIVKSSDDVGGLRHLYTEIDVHSRGLGEQGQTSDSYGVFLAPMLFEKFPKDLQLQWISEPRNKITNFDGLIKFLKKAVEARERCGSYSTSSSYSSSAIDASAAAGYSHSSKRPADYKRPAAATASGLVSTVQPRVCIFCNASHSTFNCPLAIPEKRRLVQSKRLCLNCLSSQHLVQSCPSHHKCRVCKWAHHTSLHQDAQPRQQQQQPMARAVQQQPLQQQPPQQQFQQPTALRQPPTSSQPGQSGAIPRTSAPQPNAGQQASSRPTSGSASHVVASAGVVVPFDPVLSTSPAKHVSFDETQVGSSATALSSTASASSIASKVVVLRTATVLMQTPQGEVKVRCLFDIGCQRTLIRSDVIQRSGLKSVGSEVLEVIGLHGSDGFKNRKTYLLSLTGRDQNGQSAGDPIEVYAATNDSVTPPLPRIPSGSWLQEIEEMELQLADEVGEDSGPPGVDIIFGGDVYNQLIDEKTCMKLSNGVSVCKTVFGWVLLGPVERETGSHHSTAVSMFVVAHPDQPLQDALKEHWALDSLGIQSKNDKAPSHERHPVFEEFKETIKHDGDRYIVSLPIKSAIVSLPSGEPLARQRLKSQISRLRRKPDRLKQYHQQFLEHLKLGFLELVPDAEIQQPKYQVHYLSHLMVERADKPSTPARIVFNGSASEPDQDSLNDVLEAGPNLQEDLLALNLEFRTHRFVVTADIHKAFVQIGLAEPDRDLVRCLWVDDPFVESPTLLHYRYKRVIFGLKPSPFLLGATILHHLKNYDQDSLAVNILSKKRYVDDVIAGGDSAEGLFEPVWEAKQICQEAGLPLGKFRSNSSDLRLRLLAVDANSSDPSSNDQSSKMFGLIWDCQRDLIGFDVKAILEYREATKHFKTKRFILRTSLMLYDRMGLIAPITIAPGILQQKCLIRGLSLDSELPPDLCSEWEKWCEGLSLLSRFTVSRWIFSSPPVDGIYDLHVFCDASEVGFGAVAYVLGQDSNPQLVISKARVAPLRRLTLARLELMALLIGSRLASYLIATISSKQFRVHIWSDSKVALAWLKIPAYNLQTWVANRVEETRDLVPTGSFHHCRGVDNPADLCSRGANVPDLLSSELWWKGPDWLPKWTSDQLLVDQQDELSTEEQAAVAGEKKRIPQVVAAVAVANSSFTLWAQKFDSLYKLLRVTAYIRRFIFNFRNRSKRITGPLSADEIGDAKVWWVTRVQSETYAAEFRLLRVNKLPVEPSTLVAVGGALVIDSDGLIKLRGRTLASGEPPRLLPVLPGKHPFTKLLIIDAHVSLCHAWSGDTFNHLLQFYHLVPGRRAVLETLKKCFDCRRLMGKSYEQPPGSLPAFRCTPGEPFETVGIDFAGPLFVKQVDNSSRKVYFCLFTCARSRAVHLELVRDLSAARFLLALDRFVSRRGLCREICSDNAKTFIKSSKELRVAFVKLKSHPEIQSYLGKRGITWKFIPERAPWWGGFWERAVQTVKRLLRKTLGQTCLMEDELETRIIKVEAVINSRPLTYVYSDARDPEPLTPSQLLIGRRLNLLPPFGRQQVTASNWSADDLRRCAVDRDRWADSFWNLFRKEYLYNLRLPLKGTNQPQQVKVGDVVHVAEVNAPRLTWKLGRVVSVCPSKIDGVVRAAYVKVASSSNLLRRAVNHLYPLEVPDRSELGGLRQIAPHPTMNSPLAPTNPSIEPELNAFSPETCANPIAASSISSPPNDPSINSSSNPVELVSVNARLNDHSQSCNEETIDAQRNADYLDENFVSVSAIYSSVVSPSSSISVDPIPSLPTLARTSTPAKTVGSSSSSQSTENCSTDHSSVHSGHCLGSGFATADGQPDELQRPHQLATNESDVTASSTLDEEGLPSQSTKPTRARPKKLGRGRGNLPSKEPSATPPLGGGTVTTRTRSGREVRMPGKYADYE